jgi:hypothetical protein
MHAIRRSMVRESVGLLDDAIREHLELKRLRGADAGDVARSEQEALGEASAETTAGSQAEGGRGEPVGIQDHASQPEAGEFTGEISGGQETVELDMDSLLGSDSTRSSTEDEPLDAEEPPPPPLEDAHLEDSLEWEVPGDSDSSGEVAETDGEAVEDVLEETPNFLRETPEQDRLWFEQRPPRDFDFNE